MKTILKFACVVLIAALPIYMLYSCKKDNNGQNQIDIPNVPVNITINMGLPKYLVLQSQGSWVYEEGGVRGLVIYHHYDDNFYALERNCPYQPLDSCATVTVDNSNIFLRCGHYKSSSDTTWIPCCNSLYSLEAGYLISGPSRWSLKRYAIQRSGNLLYIKN